MSYTRSDIIEMLLSEGDKKTALFAAARDARNMAIGNGIYLRGLIEYGNVCEKDCFYCGIRRSHPAKRYQLSRKQVVEAAELAYKSRYGSIVIQGGEITSERHIAEIESIVRDIKSLSSGKLGITLSLGEQSIETYAKWFDAGAHRYLLRIETSNPRLYRRLHPDDDRHVFEARLRSLEYLRDTGYQVGTGVMIGLPWQSVEDLADDILFMRELDIDMCGMGPYVTSDGTPLSACSDALQPEIWRLEMTLKMIAVLRLVMPDINIAASTALQAIDPEGRLKAVECGANIIMPNISPQETKASYKLYNNKPLVFDGRVIEDKVIWGEWGDSQHFKRR